MEELSWATRRVLERIAASSPLVTLIEDIHWAEPALLDLVGHVATVGAGPLMLIATSRPDVGEARSSILEHRRTVELRVEPLADSAAIELVAQLLPGVGDVAALRSRIAEAADGNPLYAEELVAMLVDDRVVRTSGDGSWAVDGPFERIAMPATIGALLTARLDRLGSERTVAERGSVVGRVFEERAVAHLSPELASDVLADRLAILVRRDLIRSESSSIAEELAYRFRHVLIRDAAYESLPKSERARLHESLADWLEAVTGDRLLEVEEIVGYHQEQAVLYRRQLSQGRETRLLAARAGSHLAAAATRAADRGDVRAAANLFGRAAELTESGDPHRDRLLLEEAVALSGSNEFDRADAILTDIISGTAAGDDTIRAHAAVARWNIGEIVSAKQAVIREDARAAIEVLEAAGDELGLARAWRLLGNTHWYAGEGAASEEAVLRALEHARRAGRRSEVQFCYEDLTGIFNTGPTEAAAGIERCREILAIEPEDRIVGAWMAHALAHLQAKRGDFDEARANAALTRRVLLENGQTFDHAVMAEVAGDVEYQAGDPATAFAILSDGLETLHRAGRTSAILSAHLGHVAWHAREVAAAEATADEGMAAGGWTRALTLGTLGRVRASQGRFDEAERLVREGLAHWETTDYLTYHAWTLEALGDVFAMAGRTGEAVQALERAAALHERKGSPVGVAKVMSALAKVQ